MEGNVEGEGEAVDRAIARARHGVIFSTEAR